MSDLLKLFRESSSLYGSNANFIEELYEQYLQDPDSVEESWKQKFGHIRSDSIQETAHSPIIERFASLAQQSQGRLAKLQGFTEQSVKKQSAVAPVVFIARWIICHNPFCCK